MRPRSGFTLIETVFALFVFAVGALGLAGTTAVVIRTLAVAGAHERAARVGSTRLEILRSLSCGGAQGGAETKEGIFSSWTVSPAISGVTAVSTVTYTAGGVPRTETYTASFPCAP